MLYFMHHYRLIHGEGPGATGRISNAIAELPIFEHYAFDLETP